MMLVFLAGVSLAMLSPSAGTKSFLIERKSSLKRQLAMQSPFGSAMEEDLGCGGRGSEEEIARVEQQLAPMWSTLPKDAAGNVERHSLRTAVQKHFNRRWSIHIRAFEPSQPMNDTGWGADSILSQHMPAYVEAVLESKRKTKQGFTRREASCMVVVIERVLLDWEGSVLERVFWDHGVPVTRSVTQEALVRMLSGYVIYWFLRADADTAAALLARPDLLEQEAPIWPELRELIRGKVHALEQRRRMTSFPSWHDGSSRRGRSALQLQFSFEDAHSLVVDIRRSFASWWNSECESMKAQLFEMDSHRTGRVPLAKFYGTGVEEDWRFGESEDYLRQLGALDESSWHGQQVIVSNYMQAASNCAISTPHYLICCSNDCEGLLRELEETIGAPAASPERLLEVVGGLAAQSTLDDDFPPSLAGSLVQQLDQIAGTHGGEVPLHGRLFAQWMHYAFPQECAFPQTGAKASMTPDEFEQAHGKMLASDEAMKMHASARNTSASVDKESLENMSQWSADQEKIFAEHLGGLEAPWQRRKGTAECLGLASAVGAAVALLQMSMALLGKRAGAILSRSANKDCVV